MNKIKIAMSYVVYPLSMAGYFCRALQRREDVELWTVGPYTNNWIPWNFGMYLLPKYAIPPSFPLPQGLIQYLPQWSLVDGSMPWTPDLFISFDAGWHFTDRPRCDKIVRIQSDPHVLRGFYDKDRNTYDYNFCMQHSYMVEGEMFLPYAFDPTIHYPMSIPKEFDCCLIGLHYQQRDALVNRLRDRGISVYYSIGEIYDENRIAYNKAKIALSWSTLNDVPARIMEGMAMNMPLVCNRVPDMDLFFKEGEHYLGFNDVSEAERQVSSLLADEERARAIGQNAYQTVKDAATWDKRAEAVLQTVGLI